FADHGEEFGEHGKWEHGHSLYEELLHVPFMIKLPGQRRPKRVNDLAGIIDIYPTLTELYGFKSETAPSGTSLVYVLKGGTADPDRHIIAEAMMWGPELKAVITNQYKYILNIPSGEAMLFDVVNDAGETKNLIDTKPDEAQPLGDFLEEYVKNTQSGWHLRFVFGSEFADNRPLPIDLTVSSSAIIKDAQLIKQIFNGTGDGLTIDDDHNLKLNLELVQGDIVELKFALDPENDRIKFGGTIDGIPARDFIRLGAFGLPLQKLTELIREKEDITFEPLPISEDLVLTTYDPTIAFSFPDYFREKSRGAFLWTVPESLRAHAPALTPEQKAQLESVGYIFPR
ncbi:MAG: sulfatase/phosphatase domain-containing protein, partial [bacterium]